MLGLIEFAIRLCIRFGVLIGVVALAVVLVWALVMLARIGLKPAPMSALFGMCALAALGGLAVLSQAAKDGVSHLSAAFAARDGQRPAPAGPFQIQTVALDLTAPNAAPIPVRIWYPHQAAPQHQRRLILFSPGLGGDRDQCALLLAELASQGYVIVAFDDMSQLPAPANETEDARFLREGPNDYSSRAAFERTTAARDLRAELQAHKAIDILDRFAAIANDTTAPWGGRIDVSQIGFLGYSFGGSTAAEAALLDPRISAIANLDGGLYARAREAGIVRLPYLLILSDMHMRVPVPDSLRRNFEYLQIERELTAATEQARAPHSEVMEIRLSEHALFADDYFDAAHFRQWLTLPPARAHDIVATRLTAFFAHYLPANAVATAGEQRRFEEVLELGGAA